MSGPGPEGLGEGCDVRLDAAGQRIEGRHRADQDRRRHLAAAALRVEERLDGGVVEGVGTEAVDRVGGEYDEPATLHRERGRLDRGLELVLGGGGVRRAHRAP